MGEVDPTEQLKAAASQVLSGAQLEAFMTVADAKRLADADGNIDAAKVSAGLRTLYGITETPQAPAQWGQYSGGFGPPRRPGDGARAELKKRFGVENDNPAPGPAGIRPGAAGRAEAARRYGKRDK